MNLHRFGNHRVIVIGGGSGLGRATAGAFAAEGATVGLIGRRREPLVATRAELPPAELPGAGHTIGTADITDSDAIESEVGEVAARLGGLDTVVNAAGTLVPGSVADADPDAVRELFEINVTGAWFAMRAAIRALRRFGGGTVVNFSSRVGAHRNVAGMGAYGASKAAVSAMTGAAALDHVAEGIRVVAVSPGASDTAMSYRSGENTEDRDARVGATVPAGRVARPEEIAAAVLYLAGPDADYLIGTDLVIDGGSTA